MSQLHVTVVDALMGAGKTTTAIRKMQAIAARSMFPGAVPEQFRRDGFVYLTPFLDEVERVKQALAAAPEGSVKVFEPQAVGGRKLPQFNESLRSGHNVISTHALFRHTDADTVAALQQKRYVLIIDEVADWVERYPITRDDLRDLFKNERISVDLVTKRVQWRSPEYAGKFEGLKKLCDQGKIVASVVTEQGEPTLLLWTFPAEILALFAEVYILTYQFKGSDMALYLKLHGAAVHKTTIARDGCTIVAYSEDLERERIAAIKDLVHVVEDRSLNACGVAQHPREKPLSVSWFANCKKSTEGREKIAKVRRAARRFFEVFAKVEPKLCLWSTYKTHRGDLSDKPFSRSFLACTARATNDWRTRTAVAYLLNLHHHPDIRLYFQSAGIEVNEEHFALLTMLQWVWRSAIRDKQPIKVFVPSGRMRTLLCSWLAGSLKPPVGIERSTDTETLADRERDRRARSTAQIKPVTMTEAERFA